MRKFSLISTAVMLAIASSASFALTTENGPYTLKADEQLDAITVVGGSNKQLQTQASSENGFVNQVTMTENNLLASSYIKHFGTNLQINSLEVEQGQGFLYGVGTLEFWGTGGKKQHIEINNVSLGENSFLKIQESNFDGANVNTDSSVHISSLQLSNKTALGLGSGSYNEGQSSTSDKNGADLVSVDRINLDQGTAAITTIGSTASGVIEVGSIDLGNAALVLSGDKDDLPDDVTLPDELPSFSSSATTITGQAQNNGVVTVNMNNSQSTLVLGNVGSEQNKTNLSINFSEEAFNSETSLVTFGTSATVEKSTNLSLTADNAAKGSNAENVEALNKLLDKVDTTGGQTFASTSLTATSDVFDTVTAQTNEAGEVDTSTMRTHENAEVFSFAQLHSVGVMQWREEMNHMQLRLGEIRDAAGYNNGAWARIYNGKDEYGSQDVENKYYGVQVGYDHRLEGTNWIIGGAFSYARGDSTFSTGEGDNHNFTFTGYGTWLADNGLFVDVTGKIGRLSNDITIDHYTSDYDTNAVSVTAEAGWRFALNDIFYVEPQAEMMYGHIMSADYRTQTYKADTEAVDMWVGRLGFQTGLTCPEKKGGVYFRASVLHDFDGDAETKFTGLKSGDTRKVLDELGGTWYEMGIGANYNVTDNTYLYADFQYANGGEIDTPWRWNLGVRVNF